MYRLGLRLTLRSGREPEVRPVFSEIVHVIWGMRRTVMVREGDWKLAVTRWPDSPPGTPCPWGALYDLKHDPSEEHNFYGNASYSAVTKRLLSYIESRDAAEHTET